MAATLTQIAKQAKVSVSLVSRFYNSDPTLRITAEKELRIKDAEAKLGGLRINRAARSLRNNLAYNFVMPMNQAFSLEWFTKNIGTNETFRALKDTLKKRDFRISLNMIDPEEQMDFVEDMATSSGYCDGLLLEYGIADKQMADYLLEKKFPHVCLDPRAEKLGINTVCEYGLGGVRQIVEHLLSLGHKHIGYVGTAYRYPIFLAAMSELGTPFSEADKIELPKLVLGSDMTDYRQVAAHEFAQRFTPGEGPTAYFCANDDMAMGVIDALREKGVEPGKDISIVGYDNIEVHRPGNEAEPFLTTVDIPFAQIGTRCAEVLLDQVTGGRKGIVHEQVPVELIVRGSTGPCKQ